MAKAQVKSETITELRRVEKEVPFVELSLTMEEAQVLSAILKKVTGPRVGLCRHADAIRNALKYNGIDSESNELTGTINISAILKLEDLKKDVDSSRFAW